MTLQFFALIAVVIFLLVLRERTLYRSHYRKGIDR